MTTLYYLMLKKFVRQGKVIIADISDDNFEPTVKDENDRDKLFLSEIMHHSITDDENVKKSTKKKKHMEIAVKK